MDLNKVEVAKLSFTELLAMADRADKESTKWHDRYHINIEDRDSERRSISK